ncbi:phage tail tape measure protein [Azonexus hydrophilus]|uniref:phage tail tape measure protein n=1 Tax=Azonexus hydrophilus TaxID=418702 RepID=UPI002492CF34|nr:phage tail tape measure protein [Azonexus hydrophilus]
MLGKLSFAFMIGAAVNKDHSRSVNRVQSDFDGLGKSVKDLTAQSKSLDRFGAAKASFSKLATGVREANTRLDELRQSQAKAAAAITPLAAKVSTLRTAMEAAENSATRDEKAIARLGKSLAVAEKVHDRSVASFDRLTRSVKLQEDRVNFARSAAATKIKTMRELRAELQKAQVNTAAFAKEQQRLGDVLVATKRKHELMGNVVAARSGVANAFGAAQGQVAIGAAALYGTGSSVSRPVMQSARFEDQIRQIAITGEFAGSQQEVQLGATVRKNAQLFKQTTEDINKGLQALVAEGVDAKKAGDMSAILAKGATATRASFEDLAKMTANFDKVLGVKDMELAYSQVAKAGKLGSFEIKDMAKWFPNLGGMMKSLGVTGNDAVVSMAARLQIAKMTAGSSDEAANNLKNFLAKLTSPDTQKDFGKLGIDLQKRMMGAAAKGLDPISAGVSTVMEQMAKKSPEAAAAMKKMAAEVAAIKDPAERAAELERRRGFIEKLGERAGIGKMFQDMQAVSYLLAEVQNQDKLKSITEQTKSGRSSSGAMTIDQDFADQTSITTAKIDAMKIAWSEVGVVIGDTIKPLTDGVIDSVTSIGTGIANIAKSSPAAAAGMTTILGSAIIGKAGYGLWQIGRAITGVGGALGILAKSEAAAGIGVMGKLSGAAGKVAAAFPKLAGAGRLLGPLGLLFTAGIGIASAADATKSTEERAQSGAGAVGAIGGALAGGKIGATIGTMIAPGIGSAIGGVIGAVVGAVAGEKALGELGAALARWWPGVQTWAATMSERFERVGLEIVMGISRGITSKVESLKATVTGLGDSISGWFKDKLGIRSPSRVFMGFGQMVGEGARLGIGSMVGAVAIAGGQLASAATAGDWSATVAGQQKKVTASQPSAQQSAPITVNVGPFHITQLAGEDSAALARRVAEMVKRETEGAKRAALGDWA